MEFIKYAKWVDESLPAFPLRDIAAINVYDSAIISPRATTMCLGIPMQIQAITGFSARCEAKGVTRDVSLFMLQHESLAIGDYVIVHVGYAIQKIEVQDAQTTWALFDELLAAESRVIPHA